MLILTRRIGETVKIGNDISVVVLGVKGWQCRIGIDAPKDVDILREEFADKIKREKESEPE
jgi:carbon storage regulator